jgi:hypothetical protein
LATLHFNFSPPYSYVDPLGSLITVRYTAGPDGYLETRNTQEGFVTIRQSAAPARPVVAQQPAVVAPQPNDSDLVCQKNFLQKYLLINLFLRRKRRQDFHNKRKDRNILCFSNAFRGEFFLNCVAVSLRLRGP